jgi:hypothetical protein
MSKNSVTNDEIRTKAYSTSYAEGWDKAFCKKPQQWFEILYGDSVKMLDPDGFRKEDGVTWETPVTKKEFEKRLPHCTIIWRPLDKNYKL